MIANHISVCVCTFKRPELLKRTIEGIYQQRTDNLFSYSLVVADNDPARSAQSMVEELSRQSPVKLKYCSEPEPNIAMARNMAVSHAEGEFIAFIDDDEFPAKDWLFHLVCTLKNRSVAGVLGPVRPHFESEPPNWIREGKFFERPTFQTGYPVKWDGARTGNVLFKREVLDSLEVPFRSQFATAGEDVDFFRRAMEKGHSFVWCNEADVYEVVPASRCTKEYLLRRALLRGSNFNKHPTHRLKNAAKSLIALPCYTLALPFLALGGKHIYIKYLIKLLDHGGRLLAYAGWSVVTGRQT